MLRGLRPLHPVSWGLTPPFAGLTLRRGGDAAGANSPEGAGRGAVAPQKGHGGEAPKKSPLPLGRGSGEGG